MASAFVNGIGSALTGVWRIHTQLEESDGPDSSPEAPDRFRKLRSSASLSSLRQSLRKRLPLGSVSSNAATCEEKQQSVGPVRLLGRTARNSVGSAYQKFQRSRVSRDECLVNTPGRMSEGEENCGSTPSRTPSASHTPRRTPRSASRRLPPRGGRTPEAGGAVRTVWSGRGRRQLVRMAALRSPFASPNTTNRRR
uniref:Uncharacterized protein n=2 Tax=Denticeps clupeoides TaxID=299321 RepID=A0AAY4AKZ2_9TELE